MKFKLVVIGGGISGLGLAWLAAERGISVALVEKDEICRATSNNSLRIMHGGFRYLQSLNLRRVLESAREQDYLLRKWPELIKPLPCLMPLEHGTSRGKICVGAALRLYQLLRRGVGASTLPHGELLNSNQAQARTALFGDLARDGALLWYDALLLNPPKLADDLLSKFTSAGGQVFSEATVREVLPSQNEIRVVTSNQEFLGDFVVNATGPSVDSIKDGVPKISNGWCLCFNVVLNRELEPSFGLGVRSSAGRLYFLVPRDGGSVVGTQNIPLSSAEEVSASTLEQRVDRFLREFSATLPSAKVGLQDVKCIESGILPMARVQNGEPILYGSHRAFKFGHYIKLLSTKYTTFRSQAEDVLRLLK